MLDAQSGPEQEYRPTCPGGVTPAISTDPAPHATSIGSAFHITASAPVVAYDIFPYGGGVSAITSATLLLPTTAWDTNYVAVDAYPADSSGSDGSWPFIDVISAQDGTTVTLAPKVAIVAGTGVAGAAQGQPATYSLSRGQVLHIAQPTELVGSPIQSNNPVGLIGGSRCFEVPESIQACDSAHQMIPPVKALGYQYVASRYRDRWQGQVEAPPWRIVGAVNGTTLTYDPAPPAGAPTSLTQGQVANFRSAGGFTVTSQDAQHPFYMAATGDFTGVGGCANGRHVLQSAAPFGLTVWGWGSAVTGGQIDPTQPQMGIYSQYVSYGYPAGASVQPINTVVVPPVSQ